jgi:hypothetical protein
MGGLPPGKMLTGAGIVPCQTPVTSTVTSVASIQSGRVHPLLNNRTAAMRVAPLSSRSSASHEGREDFGSGSV